MTDGPLPNRQCQDCGAKLYFAPPPPTALIDRLEGPLGRWPVLIGLGLIGTAIGVFGPWWLLVGLFALAVLVYVTRPPAWQPRCPRCGSLNVVVPDLDLKLTGDHEAA